ncbi:MAG: NADH-quinone oxidoreductase subunit B family protein [Methanopyri archaeon]|nr:NADH-quinone oxidoreductase subunit B family protein [Methanopyri archaeon]
MVCCLLKKLKGLIRSRSIHVSVVNTGGCNGCDIEILACFTYRYDLEQYGIYYHNNPRKTDVLIVTGPVTEQWKDKLPKLYDKVPEPKAVVAVGSCACSGGIFNQDGGRVGGGAAEFIPVDAEVPGCPPRPDEIVKAVVEVLPTFFRRWEFERGGGDGR